jgi:hypothetical protein
MAVPTMCLHDKVDDSFAPELEPEFFSGSSARMFQPNL